MPVRLTARQRMARLLGVIPWVVARSGASVDEVAQRFDYPRASLLRDLTEVVFFVGVHPFTPDTLIEVHVDEDFVQIHYADWFSKPLRLTSDEIARLLIAGHAVADLDPYADTDEAGPLLRALTKLQLALGDAETPSVEVHLGNAPEETLERLRRAIAEQRQVELEYYTYGRDTLTQRVVDPIRLASEQGYWYLKGWCHKAGGGRVFRVDRIRQVTVSDVEVGSSVGASGSDEFSIFSAADAPELTLLLQPGASWVADHYPLEAREDFADGTVQVRLRVTTEQWLARLLIRLGDDVEVVQQDESIPTDLVESTVARILARYSAGHDLTR